MFAVILAALAPAGPPEFDADPFGDAELAGAPLIHDVAHPMRGSAEATLFFTSSVIDRYSSHTGGTVEVVYFPLETLGLALSVGWLHGRLGSLVTGDEGVIGNNMGRCLADARVECSASDINPKVPDYAQITGVSEGALVWAPLYGKVIVVSELDVALQLYGILGGGVNGTRVVTARADAGATSRSDFTLRGDGFGEGGVFDAPRVHGVVGAGLRLFIGDRVALRGELRALAYRDTFDFDQDPATEPEGYLSWFYFTQLGLAVRVF
jgi:outer membrane beta-barrel protein